MALNSRSGPTGSRRRLRFALRATREAAALTQEQVADAMDWSLSKLLRIEAGTSAISTNDLKALLQLYGVADRQQVDRLIDMARWSRGRHFWWDRYRGHVTPSMISFLGLEAEASMIWIYALVGVPALLQTQEYAREVIRAAPGDLSQAEVDLLVEIRLSRQEMLQQADPPTIAALLDESVLHRTVGGTDVMADQLRHLSTLAGNPDIEIRVVPFSARWQPLVDGSFQILDFTEPDDPGVLHLEGDLAYSQVYEQPARIDHYRAAFRALAQASLSPEESLALIQKTLDAR